MSVERGATLGTPAGADPIEPNARSFIVMKIWLEETGEEGGDAC